MPLLALLPALLSACAQEAVAFQGPTRLAVIGDMGTGGDDEWAVAFAVRASADREGLDALVTTGDNIYPDGDPEAYDRAWRKPYGWTAELGVPVVAALGNHDVKDGHEQAEMQLLGMPARWYTRTVGGVQLIVLDANLVDDEDQAKFLRKALDARRPRGTAYRVVVFHQPAYSCARHGSTKDVLSEWEPLFADGKVDLVLNGHDHAYQRFGPVDRTTYVVTGGGGAELYPIEDCPAATPAPEVAVAAFHYVSVEATAEQLLVQARTPDGRVLDTATISPRR